MILGKIESGEKTINLKVEIYCTNCGRKVPGGIKVSEKFSKTKEMQIKLKDFKKTYLCGICRDKKRIQKK